MIIQNIAFKSISLSYKLEMQCLFQINGLQIKTLDFLGFPCMLISVLYNRSQLQSCIGHANKN